MKHTPGPWTARNEPYDDGCPYFHIVAGRGYFDSKEDAGFNITGIFSESNARLITAAPDLLEACKKAVELGWTHTEECHPSEGIHSERCKLARENLEILKAAIAKAGGEE